MSDLIADKIHEDEDTRVFIVLGKMTLEHDPDTQPSDPSDPTLS